MKSYAHWPLAKPGAQVQMYASCGTDELVVVRSATPPSVSVTTSVNIHVAPEHCYTDYKEMIAKEKPDIVSVVTQPEHRAEIM